MWLSNESKDKNPFKGFNKKQKVFFRRKTFNFMFYFIMDLNLNINCNWLLWIFESLHILHCLFCIKFFFNENCSLYWISFIFSSISTKIFSQVNSANKNKAEKYGFFLIMVTKIEFKSFMHSIEKKLWKKTNRVSKNIRIYQTSFLCFHILNKLNASTL